MSQPRLEAPPAPRAWLVCGGELGIVCARVCGGRAHTLGASDVLARAQPLAGQAGVPQADRGLQHRVDGCDVRWLDGADRPRQLGRDLLPGPEGTRVAAHRVTPQRRAHQHSRSRVSSTCQRACAHPQEFNKHFGGAIHQETGVFGGQSRPRRRPLAHRCLARLVVARRPPPASPCARAPTPGWRRVRHLCRQAARAARPEGAGAAQLPAAQGDPGRGQGLCCYSGFLCDLELPRVASWCPGAHSWRRSSPHLPPQCPPDGPRPSNRWPTGFAPRTASRPAGVGDAASVRAGQVHLGARGLPQAGQGQEVSGHARTRPSSARIGARHMSTRCALKQEPVPRVEHWHSLPALARAFTCRLLALLSVRAACACAATRWTRTSCGS